MVTKGGICLNLKESEYTYLRFGLKFYFSSKVYREKFITNVANYTKEENLKLKNKYGINCDFTIYLAISYYQKLEKRGFYITSLEGKEINSNNTLGIILLN